MSQRAMAKELGIHRVTLAGLETGARVPSDNSDLWTLIANAVDLPVDEVKRDLFRVAKRRAS